MPVDAQRERVLITPEALRRVLDNDGGVPRGWALLDVRSPRRYASGHIPGAVNVPLGHLMHMEGTAQSLVPSEAFAQAMEAAGVHDDGRVVVYGERGAMDAAYLFWALEYYGHEDVRFLDGGIEGWQRIGGELTTEPVTPTAGRFTPAIKPHLRATAEEIAARLDDEALQLIDTRTPQEFSGAFAMTAQAGHIPGALRVDWEASLDASLVFRSPEGLLETLEQCGVDPKKESVLYCLSGPRAAHLYVAMRAAGLDTARVYDRSWSEWGNRPELPAATVPAS